MKKIIRGISIGIIIAVMLTSTVLGAQVKKTIDVIYNSVNLTVNGSKVNADNILYEGITYIPIRAIAEALGKEVGWSQETFTASIDDKKLDSVTKDIQPIKVNTITGNKTIEIIYNSINLTVNGSKINADNILYTGTTYVPIRAVAEALGKDVGWDQKTYTASICDKADNLVRVDTIEINGKKYKASYFGKQDMEWSEDYDYREFWRIEDAYGNFKNNQITTQVLPYNNFPIPVNTGEVFIIDYTKKDGSVERRYNRSDGTFWNDLATTVEFLLEEANSINDKNSIYLEDALNLISVIEDTHPAFPLGDISDKYEQEKQQFINSINKNTTMNEFTYLVQRYLTFLQDSHTKVQRNAITGYLDLVYQSIGDEMFLSTKDGVLLKNKVTKIGGVSINEIYKTVGIYYATENEVAKDLNNNRFALSYEILKLAGCEINNETVEVTIDNNGMLSKKNIKFGNFVNGHIFSNDQNTVEVESRMIDDIFYIDMNVCIDNIILDNQIIKLKQAIKNGITKVIIDVRDNPGGTSNAGDKLLFAMNMSPPSLGMYTRYSEQVKNLGYGYPSEGFEQYNPDKTTAKRNEDIELVVLMNEWTYSAAALLTVYVKDGNLGTIIGRPCANAPTRYGSALSYKLPSSKIDLTISFKKFLRPDTKANPKILLPDIVTEYNTDSLNTAIDYLNKK